MNRRLRYTVRGMAGALGAALMPCAARARGFFDTPPETDWANSWLDAVFHGVALPPGFGAGTSSLPVLSAALREALGVFSLGMLVLAGFLLLYRVGVMVVETAHTGVVLGRGTSRLWTPLRFVIAISLLVPVGGGLNAGQRLVVLLARAGSSLASSAWTGAAMVMKEGFSNVVPPLRTDATRLTIMAFEMEMCRALYRQVYVQGQNDTLIARLGNMDDFQKEPRGRLMPETWRYTNRLQPGLPLCGAYRYLSLSSGAVRAGGQNPDNFAAFARADAERLSMQTRQLAERQAPAFFAVATNGSLPVRDVRGVLIGLILEQQRTLDALLQTMAARKTSGFDQVWDESAAAGWLSAGLVTGVIARRQAFLGAQAEEALPSAQAPLFGHKAMDRAALLEAVAADPFLRQAAPVQLDRVLGFYETVNMAMKRMRGWLYGSVLADIDDIRADTLDVHDLSDATNDADTSAFLFARVISAAAAAYGVWESPPSGVNGEPAKESIQNLPGNPLAALAETGRRYTAFGRYMLAMTGPVLMQPTTLGAGLGFVFFGFAFVVAGLLMLFVLPLFPLARFFLGVLAWVIAVFEAVAALPLVALAHLSPVGEGFSGALARRSYWLWLRVFMRPVLTLFGFMIGLALLTLALGLLNALFGPLMKTVSVASGDGLMAVQAGFAFLYAVLTVVAANAAFKSVDWLPAHILDWLGDSVVQEMAGSSLGAGNLAALSVTGPTGGGPTVVTASMANHSHRDVQDAGDGLDVRTGTRSAHGLKSALIPAYQERPVSASEESAVAERSGTSLSVTGSAAVSSGGQGATAVASATASAQATAVLNPGFPHEQSLIKSTHDRRDLTPPKPDKNQRAREQEEALDEKDESPEQSSAPPESDDPA